MRYIFYMDVQMMRPEVKCCPCQEFNYEEVSMNRTDKQKAVKVISVFSSVLGALLLITIVIVAAHKSALNIYAAPIDPPEGYPKLTQSIKTVTPTLALTGGATLHYLIEIRNTGAYVAESVTLSDTIPAATLYNDDAWQVHQRCLLS